MRLINVISLILLCSILANAQELDKRYFTDQYNYVPDEIIVRFKDEIVITKTSGLKSVGISNIDKIFSENNIISYSQLFYGSKKIKSAKVVKTPLGQEMIIPNLHNIFLLKLDQNENTQKSILEIAKEFELLDEVVYAEPNYIFSIDNFEPEGEEMTMLEAMERKSNNNIPENASGLIPNDPLYNSQWGISACNIDDVWNETTGDSTSIIVIMDTGVDWLHPDLKDNIWVNKAEINGITGYDDDGNGYIDDIRGWDFINNDNNPLDDNSHGTHVAGIAAAKGNNGIGIAGVNWNAKILPLKVFQSSGQGDAATIALGVIYAINNGATVINMSFGSYAESLTLKNALASAYETAVLVAAAGNDGTPIGPCLDCAPMFPGAFSFVLGVEANKKIPTACSLGAPEIRACFSNFDQDGPVFSQYTDLLNYELRAPGTEILSCAPGGNYREYNGTSMAVPIVAGAVSLYLKQKPEESQELLFGNLINSQGQHMDLEAALNIVPEPKLNIVSYEIIDTLDGDGDGRPDVGETIELKVMVRNSWGQANDVKVGVEFGEFEDQTILTILTSESSIGSISAYATKENIIALKIKLAANINDGRDIVFNLKTWYGDHLGEEIQQIIFDVENGIELSGYYKGVTKLTPQNLYIITDNVVFDSLYINPGTILRIAKDKTISIFKTIIANGNPDSMIIFTRKDQDCWGSLNYNGIAKASLKYCIIEYAGGGERGSVLNFDTMENCIIQFNIQRIFVDQTPNFFNNNMLIYNYTIGYQSVFHCTDWRVKSFTNNVVTNNKTRDVAVEGLYSFMRNNSIFNNDDSYYGTPIPGIGGGRWINEGVLTMSPNYLGTYNSELIKKNIYEYFDNPGLAIIVGDSAQIEPSPNCHGIVWKILVNGKDAQDEFDHLDPLGVGQQKFEVYFNRAMDTMVTPNVSMGVRYPFTQTPISKDGKWSADSTIYNAFMNIGLTTGDGINTIRVSEAEDTDHFEIPIEDRRFKVIIDATGTLSDEFKAIAAMSKINLTWQTPSKELINDVLGYNMYRFTNVTDSTYSDTTLINSSLILDTFYVDNNVEPDKRYFYSYKVLRTNFDETDFSKVVSNTPLTPLMGDANGNQSVENTDITAIISFLNNQNPDPFVIEAADIDENGIINILDIVQTLNIINTDYPTSVEFENKTVITIQNDTVYLETTIPISGFQFKLKGIDANSIQVLPILNQFEISKFDIDYSVLFLAYSMSGKKINVGKIPILKLNNNSWIDSALLSTTDGIEINVEIKDNATAIDSPLKMNQLFELGNAYPNPFLTKTTIPYYLSKNVDYVFIEIRNIIGEIVKEWKINNCTLGDHQIVWNAQPRTGMYFYTMKINTKGKLSGSQTKKLLVQ